MKTLILLVIVSSLGFAQATAHKSAAPAKTGAAKKTGTVGVSSARTANPALWTKQAPEEYKAKLATTKGDIIIDVHRDWAPRGADRFYNLVRSGYLNNAAFYRVAPGFIVQFGAAADPKVGAAWERATIKDDPVKHTNAPYTITFAATGQPNSRSTELFINLGNNGALDSQGFAAFGEVVEGKELVAQIYSGYGEMKEQGGNGPSQQLLKMHGKPYLDKNFPKLDSIKTATILSGEPAPAAKAAPKTAAPATKKAAPKSPAK